MLRASLLEPFCGPLPGKVVRCPTCLGLCFSALLLWKENTPCLAIHMHWVCR